jgi:hypothetical protein
MYGTLWMNVRVSASFSVARMQEADVRVGALDHLAVELEHQAQHAVGRRMLRPEIHRVVADLRHYSGFGSTGSPYTSSRITRGRCRGLDRHRLVDHALLLGS